VPPEPAQAASADAGGAGDDPEAALRRLESMGKRGTAAQPPADVVGSPSADARGPSPADAGGLPPAPIVDPFREPPPPRSQHPMGSSRRTPKVRPHPAGSRSSRIAARIAAPIVFLIAVIALVSIVANSGVFDGGPVATPTATPSKSAAAKTATKKYVIKSGDSLSIIAARFHITTAELIRLNPDLDGTSTLVVGTRIVVPKQ
jgi:LysM repeat protein